MGNGDNEEKFGIKEFSVKECDNKTGLESQDGDNEKTSSNPFYINFDMFCGKSPEEFPYDKKLMITMKDLILGIYMDYLYVFLKKLLLKFMEDIIKLNGVILLQFIKC